MVAGILFIVADGARARLVTRSAESGDFVTLRKVEGGERLKALRAKLQASPPGRSQESMSPTRRSIGPTEAPRHAKEAFVTEVAALAVTEFSDRARDGVVLVAPLRLTTVMQESLEGRLKVAAVLPKDLTKVPDHELHDWLDPIRPRRSA